MENLLQVRQLKIAFRNQEIIHGINFNIPKGKIVAIVGESGSGKSVTSMAIMGLLATKNLHTSGEINWTNSNENISNLLLLSSEELNKWRGKKMAMIFQEPMTSLNPVLTCGQQVAESILYHNRVSKNEAKAKTISLFQEVELPDPDLLFYKYPHQISGGQKQRVMIAMAMSCQPELLICDEPTTALDVTVQKSILRLIKKLQSTNGMSVIFISHDLNVVSEIADEIIVLYKGKIMECGQKSQVLGHPKSLYTKALLACRPALYNKGERLPIVSDFLHPNLIKEAKSFAKCKSFNPTEKIVEVKNIDVWYPLKKNIFGKTTQFLKTIENLSFEVFKGETLGLVGGSGCGKSTLGRTILRLEQNRGGEILFKSKRIDNLSDRDYFHLRPKMQLIFQDPYSALNPQISIGEAIAEPLRIHKLIPKNEIRKYVEEWLKKVDLLPEYYDRKPHEFSGGQRQRIVIARALAMNPEFVICDESVSALDVSVQSQVLNLINDLKAEMGFTAIFISHDLSVVKYLCDRVMIMDKGKIIESGTAEEVYANPKEAYTQLLLSSIPKLEIN